MAMFERNCRGWAKANDGHSSADIGSALAGYALRFVTLGALFGFAASAQQNHGPQSEAAAPAAGSTPASPSRASPSQNVSRWQQALVARLDVSV